MTDEIQTTAGALDEAKAALLNAENKHGELSRSLERAKDDAASSRKKAHELAYSAIDDDSARRVSVKLLADAAKLDDDIKHRLEPAVAEARRRLEAVRQAASQEAQRARAAEAKAIALKLEGLGAGRDKAFEEAKLLGLEFDAAINRLRALGAPAPSLELVAVNVDRALDSALMAIHPKAARLVPPLQRHKFVELYASWAAPALSWAAKILDVDARRVA